MSEEEVKKCMIALSNKTKFEERTLNKFLHMTWVFIDEGDSEHLIPILNTKISVLEKKISELQGSHKEVLKEACDKNLSENFIDQLIDAQLGVYNSFLEQVAKLKAFVKTKEELVNKQGSSNFEQSESSDSKACSIKMPELKLPTFSDNSSGISTYLTFSSQFSNTIKLHPGLTSESKFLYLRNCLKGRALALIEELEVDEDSYRQAFELLDHHFLDRDLIKQHCFASIIEFPPCSNLSEIETFLAEMNKVTYQLIKLDLDFSAVGPGNELLSHLVRSKLPRFFLQEVVRKSGEIYPNYISILNLAVDVVKLLKVGNVKKTVTKPEKTKTFDNAIKPKQTKTELSEKASRGSGKGCVFCSLSNHSSLHCKKYSNHASRIKRAEELGRCVQCLSTSHKANSCPAKEGKLPFSCSSCGTSSHVTPLCPSVQLSFSAAKTVSSSDKQI